LRMQMQMALADPKAYAPKLDPVAAVPTNIGPVIELLKVLLKAVAEDADVAPRLIATMPDLEQIAAFDDAKVAAMSGWRRKVFGEKALRLKRGELALVLENGKVEVVELE